MQSAMEICVHLKQGRVDTNGIFQSAFSAMATASAAVAGTIANSFI